MKRILLFISILLISCDKKGPTEPGFGLGEIHFAAGKQFMYAWSFESRDSVGDLVFSLHDTIVVGVESTDDVVDTLSGLVRLRAYSVVDSIGSSLVWYRNTQSSCAEVAYAGAGQVPPVLPKIGTTPPWAGIIDRASLVFVPLAVQRVLPCASLSRNDSAIMRQDPRIVFKYPLSEGQSWTSFTDPFLQTRVVVGSETVQISAGSRLCAKIKTDSPIFNPKTEWYDYVDADGLILRTVTMNVIMTNPDNPESQGTLLVNERAELLSIATTP